MLAVSLDDFRIMIIDVDTRKIVRTFNGHQNVITDLVRIYIYINTMLE
jgi:U3 small nucleolar RNA-associated protein 21